MSLDVLSIINHDAVLILTERKAITSLGVKDAWRKATISLVPMR